MMVVTVAIIGGGWFGTPASTLGPDSSSAPTEAVSYWLSDTGVERATDFREKAQLEASRSWVEHVAVDPDALANLPQYGVPLTSAEIAVLAGRAKSISEVRRVTDRFATEHPEAWGGDYTSGGQLVVVLVDPTGELSSELGAKVAPGAPFRIQQGAYTLAELTELKERISSDYWLSTHYKLTELGVTPARNLVELQVSSDDPSVPAEIVAHYDVGDRLAVTIDGTGVLEMPKGRLRGQALYPNGVPAAHLVILLEGDVAGAGSTGDRAIETDVDGSFEFRDIAATGYLVRFMNQFDRNGEYVTAQFWTELGSKRVEVKPGETTDVQVVVARP